jgi:hypothetical protein
MLCGPPQKQPSILVGRSVGQSVSRSVGRSVDRSQGSHTNVILPLQFRHLGPPFPTLLRRRIYALRATPKTALNFGRLVGWLIGRSRGSHTNVMLPLQFRHPGLPLPTLLRPAGHPKTALNFGWSVGRSVGRSQGSHTNVTLPIQFHHQGPLFPTLLRPMRHPQNDL